MLLQYINNNVALARSTFLKYVNLTKYGYDFAPNAAFGRSSVDMDACTTRAANAALDAQNSTVTELFFNYEAVYQNVKILESNLCA